MKLKKTSWKDISLSDFEKIKKVLDYEDDLQKQVGVVAILCGCTEDDVESIPITEFKSLAEQTLFINEYPNNPVLPTYTIAGKEYSLDINIRHMTTAQYMDFQTFIHDVEKNAHHLVACFLVPKGKKYGDGYDVIDVAEMVRSEMSYADVTAIIGFFLAWFRDSTRIMLSSPLNRLKWKMWMAKDKKEKMRIGRVIVALSRLAGDGLH